MSFCYVTHVPSHMLKNKQEEIRVKGHQMRVKLPMAAESKTFRPSPLKKNFVMQQGSKKASTFQIQSMKPGLDSIIPMWIAAILVFLFLKPPLPTHLLHSHPPHPHNPCPQLRKHQPNQLCHTNHHQRLQAGQIKYPRTNVHLSLTC